MATIMIVVFRLLDLPGSAWEFGDGGAGNVVVGAVARLTFDSVAAARVTSFGLLEAASPPVVLLMIWVGAVSRFACRRALKLCLKLEPLP